MTETVTDKLAVQIDYGHDTAGAWHGAPQVEEGFPPCPWAIAYDRLQ